MQQSFDAKFRDECADREAWWRAFEARQAEQRATLVWFQQFAQAVENLRNEQEKLSEELRRRKCL